MEIPEAIARIKNHNEIHSRKEKGFAIHITEALNLAVEILEKHILKKPIEDETKCADGSTCDVVFRCPECKRMVCFKDYENHLEKEYPYCHCGQALDWSDYK